MEQDWVNLEAFWTYCRKNAITPSLRLLLTSSGTVTKHLKALTLRSVDVEIKRQGEILISDALSERIEIPKGEWGYERRVWLRSGRPLAPDADALERADRRIPQGTGLLSAVSTFPISRLKPELYQEMKSGKKPLGQIIEEKGLQTFRDRFEISHLPFPDTAEGLGLSQDTLFWARRYRINISDQASAYIREVFSPHTSSFLS
ncbi:MAG: chorismate--pyruvate lyase family protein [Nitrospiria bacterium]